MGCAATWWPRNSECRRIWRERRQRSRNRTPPRPRNIWTGRSRMSKRSKDSWGGKHACVKFAGYAGVVRRRRAARREGRADQNVALVERAFVRDFSSVERWRLLREDRANDSGGAAG